MGWSRSRGLIVAVSLLFALGLTAGCGGKKKRRDGGGAGGLGSTFAGSTVQHATGTSYVTNMFKGQVTVMDNVSRQVVKTIHVGSLPSAVNFDPQGQRGYITRYSSTDVKVLDANTNDVVGDVSLKAGGGFFGFLNNGYGASDSAFSLDGKTAFVTNFVTSNLMTVDATQGKVTRTTRLFPAGIGASDVTLTTDGGRALVTNTLSGNLAVVDVATGNVARYVPVGMGPMGVAVSRDGVWAYVACSISSDVYKVDLRTLSIAGVAATGGIGTCDLAVTEDGTRVFAANFISGEIVVIDTATLKPTTTIMAGGTLAGVLGSNNGALSSLFQNFLYYFGSNAGGLASVLTNIGANPTAGNGTNAGSGNILNALLGAFLQFMGVNQGQRSAILTGALQGAVSMSIGLKGLAIAPGSTKGFVTNLLSGAVSEFDVNTRRVVHTGVTVGPGGVEVCILNRSSVPGGTAPAPAPVPAPPITTPGTPTAPPAGGTPTAPPAGGTPTPTPTPTPAPGGPTVGAIVGVTAAPTQVNPGDTFKIEWSVAGVQNVTHTNVHLDIVTHTSVEWQTGIGRFFGPVRTGTNGNYDNSFVAPPSAGTFYYVVHVQADGKDTYTSEATVTVGQPSSGGPTPPGGGSTPAAQPTTTVTGFPATVAPGASFDIAWEIADPNGAALSVAHSNIHFDVVSHTAAEWSNLAGQFGPIQSGAAGKYKNTLVAPAQPGKVFFVVHSVINGTDLYTSQQEIEVK